MNIFQLLRPAAHVPRIEGDQAIQKSYRYWRARVFGGIYIGYVFYYFSRKSMTFAVPVIMSEMGFTKSEIGILASLLAIMYGMSKFCSGVVADRSNPRYFMSIGLIFTGLANCCFGFSSSLLLFACFAAVNGFFQGWGWPPCARQLTHWFSQKERGTWWGMWNTSHSLGISGIAILGAVVSSQFGWRAAMFVPGIIAICGGFLIMFILRDTPQSVGLPSIEVFKGEEAKGALTKERELNIKEILFKYVINNRYLWILAFAYFFIYMIRQAITDWGYLYLIEAKGYDKLLASSCIVSIEVGGFFGSITAGWSSDYFFKGKRGPVTTLFSLAILAPLSYFWMAPIAPQFVDIFFFFLAGFLIYGPQMVIGMHAAELAHKKAAATASGFTGSFAYAGAAMAGYPLSLLTQLLGWRAFFSALLGAAAIATMLLAPLWSLQKRPEPVAV